MDTKIKTTMTFTITQKMKYLSVNLKIKHVQDLYAETIQC